METNNQTITTENKTSKISQGGIALIAGGLIFIFLLALGSWTDNRFGTHLVLSSDLSSSPDWFLYTIAVIGSVTAIAGIVLAILKPLGVFNLDEKKERGLVIGSVLLIGTAAFILALSSISFAAFNWQYFSSELSSSKGISNQAQAWMSLTIIAVVLVIAFIILSMLNLINMEDKMYRTLRNSSVALVALGWLVFNLCINSFGSMGGDAEVLVQGLAGISLSNIGSVLNEKLPELQTLSTIGEQLDYISSFTGNELYTIITGNDAPGKFDVVAKNVIKVWDDGTGAGMMAIAAVSPALKNLISNQGGLANLLHTISLPLEVVGHLPTYLQSFAKDGMIMGVNNSANSILIFTSLLGLGLIGIPVYGVLTYNSEDKTSIMFWGSIGVIIAAFVLYFILLLTPYMAAVEEHGILESLLLGEFGGFAPGLIAQAGQQGGIHSAIVYFSPQYNGTTVWWIAEVITFIIPVVAFITAWLVTRGSNSNNESASAE